MHIHTADSSEAEQGHQGVGWALRTCRLAGTEFQLYRASGALGTGGGATAQQCECTSYHSFERSVKMVNLMFVR